LIVASDVAEAQAEAEEMDRVYAVNLAMIRKAAQLTQVEVAKRLSPAMACRQSFPGQVLILLRTR
jgi:hypothetical protein